MSNKAAWWQGSLFHSDEAVGKEVPSSKGPTVAWAWVCSRDGKCGWILSAFILMFKGVCPQRPKDLQSRSCMQLKSRDSSPSECSLLLTDWMWRLSKARPTLGVQGIRLYPSPCILLSVLGTVTWCFHSVWIPSPGPSSVVLCCAMLTIIGAGSIWAHQACLHDPERALDCYWGWPWGHNLMQGWVD